MRELCHRLQVFACPTFDQKGNAPFTHDQIARPGDPGLGHENHGVAGRIAVTEVVELHHSAAQIQLQVLIEDQIRETQSYIAEHRLVVAHGWQQKLFLSLKISHALRGLLLGYDQCLLGEGVVPEGVVAMVVGVDHVEDWLIGYLAHGGLDQPGHRCIDVRVDHEDAMLAHYKATVVHWRLAGKQAVDATC